MIHISKFIKEYYERKWEIRKLEKLIEKYKKQNEHNNAHR